tara:strand:+ start:18531 stop:19100 length:570 start_codon:yes stop_codon:yes gene_type:complete
MIINRDKKFMFICVAKTASTSIRRRFEHYQDPPPEKYHMFLEDALKLYPYARDYFKFAFVRNPYDRLYSCYINFKYDGHVWDTHIKKEHSFRSFIMNLAQSEYSKYIHLQPQYKYIKDGNEIGVDFLGRFENLDKDFAKIESILGYPPQALERIRASSKNREANKYDSEMKEVMQKIYAEDFERFDYEK